MTSRIILLSAVVVGLSFIGATPNSNSANAKCVAQRSGYVGILSTNQFEDASGNLVFKPYYFNKNGNLAYDPISPDSHKKINAEFQACSPNYAEEPNGVDDELLYGRLYIPSIDKCLAVSNPSGAPPYYVISATCPTAKEMSTEKSIPFNFVADGSGGDVDFRWLSATIPSKSKYQGPNPPARYCFGQYFVNSTNLEYGYNTDALGQPNTIGGDPEAYRIHLYCNHAQGGGQGTGYNSFAFQ